MPTARGWAVLGAVVGALVAAWWLSYPELALLAAGGLTTLLAGVTWQLRPLPVRVHREIAPDRVTKGEPALGLVRVNNPSRRSTRAVAATDRCDGHPTTVDIPRLHAGEGHTVTYPLPTARRGEVRIGPLDASLVDPLGLFRRRRSYGQVVTLLVRPRTVRLATPSSGRSAGVEGTTSPIAGGTATFHAVREYVPGDDRRHVHWRSTARTGALMVRDLAEAGRPTTFVLLDDRGAAYADPDDFEVAVDIAASVAAEALRSGFPAAFATTHAVLVRSGGGRSLGLLLDRLASIHCRGTGDLRAAVEMVRPRPGSAGGSLTVVTGPVGPAELGDLAVARIGFDRTIVIRVGPRPPAAPAAFEGTCLDVTDLAGAVAGWAGVTR